MFKKTWLKCFSVVLLTLFLFLLIPGVAEATFARGDTVEVQNTRAAGGLSVRATPAGDRITRMPDGTRGEIIAGPQRAALGGTTFTWWRINWGATIGWSAERMPGGNWWLRKIAPTVSARIDRHLPNTRMTVEAGTSFNLTVWFTNTGDAGHFYPGVSIWDSAPGTPNRRRPFNEFGRRIHLASGAQGSYTWRTSLPTAGDYWLQFGVWNERRTRPILDTEPSPSRNLIRVIARATEDTLSPSLTITSPANNEHFTTASITVRGRASDAGRGDSGINRVEVNGFRAVGGTATGSGTANWHQTISLSSGANTIRVVAFDNSPRQNSTTQTITVYYEPLTISARIDRYSVSPREVNVGDAVTIGFTFTNTGRVTHTFGAGATLRGPDGARIDFLTPVTVAPGEPASAEWTHTIDMAGRWNVVFAVWRVSIRPLRGLLDQTGWVDEYIIAVAEELVEEEPVDRPLVVYKTRDEWKCPTWCQRRVRYFNNPFMPVSDHPFAGIIIHHTVCVNYRNPLERRLFRKMADHAGNASCRILR